MIQTDKDFQLILKEFEINQKAILIEIKKLPYQIRTESRTRSRTGSYKLTPRVKDLFKNIQIEVDRSISVMTELKNQELLKTISRTKINKRLQIILKTMDVTFTALEKFDDQEIILEYFHKYIQKISKFIQEKN